MTYSFNNLMIQVSDMVVNNELKARYAQVALASALNRIRRANPGAYGRWSMDPRKANWERSWEGIGRAIDKSEGDFREWRKTLDMNDDLLSEIDKIIESKFQELIATEMPAPDPNQHLHLRAAVYPYTPNRTPGRSM